MWAFYLSASRVTTTAWPDKSILLPQLAKQKEVEYSLRKAYANDEPEFASQKGHVAPNLDTANFCNLTFYAEFLSESLITVCLKVLSLGH